MDAHSSTPLYEQLLSQLEPLLQSGAFAAGQGLPAERMLAEHLGVSRMVVQRCYQALRKGEWLRSSGRGGTRVMQAPKVMPEMGRLKGFSEEMRELGLEPTTHVIERVVVHDRTMASIFKRTSASPLLRLVRVRLGSGVPMSREVAWYDVALAPSLAQWDGHGSAYGWLREHGGVTLAYADQTVEAVFSGPAEGEVFGYAQPQPCLLLKRHTYTNEGRLAEYAEGVFRGDAYTYRLRLLT